MNTPKNLSFLHDHIVREFVNKAILTGLTEGTFPRSILCYEFLIYL